MTTFNIIASVDKNLGMAKMGENKMPWSFKGDLQYFKQVTTSVNPFKPNVCIMGRKTFETLKCPLVNRINVVLSKKMMPRPGIIVSRSLEEAFQGLNYDNIGEIFIIGGEQLYKKALGPFFGNFCKNIYLTTINSDFQCDLFFPDIPMHYNQVFISSHEECTKDCSDDPQVLHYYIINKFINTQLQEENKEEMQYLNLVRKVIKEGVDRPDRTGTGTRAIFGATMRFDLSDGKLPLLTTKRTAWKTCLKELLWFISGDTNNKTLQAQNVHIWDGNSTKEFMESRGLGHYEEGELGPIYGSQWRTFGDRGVDQLQDVIDQIQKDPYSRRHIVCAWNPLDLDKMALVPCHVLFQFFVADGTLSCQMYQRSADLGLGVPFNIASYSLLTHMIAQLCGLKAKEFIHVIGDAHVYNDHIEPLEEQLKRQPFPFPKIKIVPREFIEEYDVNDFELVDYQYHPTIKMKMSA